MINPLFQHSNTPLLHYFGLRPLAIRLQLGQMFFRPSAKRLQGFDQCASQFCERIFNFRRHDRVHFALYQAIALETAQCLRQHLLRDAPDGAMQLGITHRSARQDLNDERRPFVGNPVEHKP